MMVHDAMMLMRVWERRKRKERERKKREISFSRAAIFWPRRRPAPVRRSAFSSRPSSWCSRSSSMWVTGHWFIKLSLSYIDWFISVSVDAVLSSNSIFYSALHALIRFEIIKVELIISFRDRTEWVCASFHRLVSWPCRSTPCSPSFWSVSFGDFYWFSRFFYHFSWLITLVGSCIFVFHQSDLCWIMHFTTIECRQGIRDVPYLLSSCVAAFPDLSHRLLIGGNLKKVDDRKLASVSAFFLSSIID